MLFCPQFFDAYSPGYPYADKTNAERKERVKKRQKEKPSNV
jgi:hypothetical protein